MEYVIRWPVAYKVFVIHYSNYLKDTSSVLLW